MKRLKRLIYILLFMPTLCWGQGINVVHMPARPVFVIPVGGLGAELITETDFSNDTYWEDAGTVTSEGDLTFTTSTAGGNRGQPPNGVDVNDGTDYRMTVTGTSSVAWRVGNYANNDTYYTQAITGAFDDTFDFTANGDGLYIRHNAAGTITFTTLSCKEIL